MKFYVTYDVTSPDSTEQGEAIERGYTAPGGWTYQDPEGAEWTLRDLFSRFGRGGLSEGDGESLSTPDGEIDYRSGEVTRYTLHRPEGCTASSWARVEAILG